MSHFTVYVFSNDEGADLEDLLAPYDENIVMEPYVKYTREQAIAKVRKDIEDYKNSNFWKEWLADPVAYKEKHKSSEGHISYLENEFPKMLKFTDDECYEYERQWYEDDNLIDADGNLLSTYNPKSKWDWYEAGGRWAGGLIMTDGKEVNDAFVSEIDWEKTGYPFAFITPDGEWHEKGKMGWWACVTNKKPEDDLHKIFDDAIKNMPDDAYVTLVDCHI